MANRTFIQARHAALQPNPALRAPLLKPIPMLLAALLVGCASSGHHTTGALKQEPAASAPAYQPPAYESPARSTIHEETPPVTVFKDEAAHPTADDPVRPEKFEDDSVAENDESAPQDHFTDDTPEAKDELVAAEHFTDDTAPMKNEVVAAEHFTDDTAPMKDEDVAPERFADDAPVVKDETVAQQHFTDDAGPAKDDEVIGAQHFTDDTPEAKDEVVAAEHFTDDTAPGAPEPFVRTPEPAEQAVTQAHEPRSRPVTMLPMTVTLEADPLFEFDRDAIGAEARRKLDELIQQLKGIPYGEIITLGYTDPIGTEAYNQKLSERRAASVTRYLVNNGIPADKIRVEARGETEDFATYKACKGQGRQKLIECLQPDRRVEVTVTTSKEQQ